MNNILGRGSSQLYKQEGLDIKRKNLMRSRRELKKLGMESLYAVR